MNKPIKENKKTESPQKFPIAGIGASAGGLETFSELLLNLPKDTGIAYVFICHLSPEHKSIMSDLLAKKTPMLVHEAKNNTIALPNNVYVIPPNKYMTIKEGRLKLAPRTFFSGVNMPIDYFFRSLAEDQKDKCIGIVLSGTATDGALGLQEIRKVNGITFVQEPKSAQHASMPIAAIATGPVDYILPPDGIALELIRISKHPHTKAELGYMSEDRAVPVMLEKDETALMDIFSILHSATGVDFQNYKKTTLLRRLSRRTTLLKKDTFRDYVDYLKENRGEVVSLYQDLLISVTKFFRDPSVFVELKKKVFPALVKDRTENDPIRIWVAGCSGGEETYSIAMCLVEYLEENNLSFPIQVLATDLSEKEIARARAGIYIENIALDVSPERLARFFVKENINYQIQKRIRDMCVFAKHDLTSNPPFSGMDLISCRNVLIYMEQILQNKIMPLFHFSLKTHGYIVLGASETIGRFTHLFSPLDNKHKIYAKKATSRKMNFQFISPNFEQVGNTPTVMDRARANKLTREATFDIHTISDRLLLASFVPASVLVNEDMEILQFRGQTELFLQPASGAATFNLLKMAKEGLKFPLQSTIAKAKKMGGVTTRQEIVIVDKGRTQTVNIEIIPVKVSNTKERYFLVLFKTAMLGDESAQPTNSKTSEKISKKASKNGLENHEPLMRELAQVRQELETTKEYLQMATEEREATNEELKASNEEIQSSNEELQSTNEEIQTAKEELQSTNEELTTLNHELQTRNIELADSIDYAESVIATVREPILILCSDLRIKSTNSSFYKMFGLSKEQTEGSLFYELNEGSWNIPGLRRLLEEILPLDKQFENFEVNYMLPGIGERNLLLNARKLSQRINKESLILLAIEDITLSKQVKDNLTISEIRYRRLFETAKDGILILDVNTARITDANPFICTILGFSREELLDKELWELGFFKDKKANQEAVKELQKNKFIRYEDLPLQTRTGKLVNVEFVSNVYRENGHTVIQSNIRDITERKKIENKLLVTMEEQVTNSRKLEEALRSKDEFIGVASHELKTPITSVKAYTEILHRRFKKVGDTQSAELVSKMNTQIDKITNLIEDLLDVTKFENGKLVYHKELFDFNKFVRDVAEEIQNITDTHTIQIKLQSAQTVFGDRERLGQVIINFITNAIKYTAHVDDKPKSNKQEKNKEKIIIKTIVSKDNIILSVQDFGIGLLKEDHGKVFERFYRVGGVDEGTYAGLGLGLYISAEIIKRHHGKIWVESKKEKGSTFFFSLPLNQSTQEN
ncbi:MAG: PAS domain S-box protein [bacterium]|nr:PAS domain S-box protein [bacterium]